MRNFDGYIRNQQFKIRGEIYSIPEEQMEQFVVMLQEAEFELSHSPDSSAVLLRQAWEYFWLMPNNYKGFVEIRNASGIEFRYNEESGLPQNSNHFHTKSEYFVSNDMIGADSDQLYCNYPHYKHTYPDGPLRIAFISVYEYVHAVCNGGAHFRLDPAKTPKMLVEAVRNLTYEKVLAAFKYTNLILNGAFGLRSSNIVSYDEKFVPVGRYFRQPNTSQEPSEWSYSETENQDSFYPKSIYLGVAKYCINDTQQENTLTSRALIKEYRLNTHDATEVKTFEIMEERYFYLSQYRGENDNAVAPSIPILFNQPKSRTNVRHLAYAVPAEGKVKRLDAFASTYAGDKLKLCKDIVDRIARIEESRNCVVRGLTHEDLWVCSINNRMWNGLIYTGWELLHPNSEAAQVSTAVEKTLYPVIEARCCNSRYSSSMGNEYEFNDSRSTVYSLCIIICDIFNGYNSLNGRAAYKTFMNNCNNIGANLKKLINDILDNPIKENGIKTAADFSMAMKTAIENDSAANKTVMQPAVEDVEQELEEAVRNDESEAMECECPSYIMIEPNDSLFTVIRKWINRKKNY